MGLATATFEAGLVSSQLFAAARVLAPVDPELVLSQAAALVAEDRASDAESLIAPIVAAHPHWVRGHEALANLRWMMGISGDFARSFAEAARIAPTDLALRFAWYRALSQVERWDDALSVIEEGRRRVGTLLEFDAAEAHVRTECGDDARADALFARSVSLNDAGTTVSYIRHALRTGQLACAERLAATLVGGPAESTVWPYLSVIWRLRGDARAGWLDGDPPYIRVCDLSFAEQDLAALANRLRRLHQSRHHPPEQSLRNGTQTDGPLFARLEPEICDVRDKVVDAVRSFVDALPAPDPAHPLLRTSRRRVRFAGSWSVRLHAKGFHVGHTHPMGWISSALYVALPDDPGPPPSGWLQLGAPPADLRVALPSYVQVEPKPGRLVLFPSTMWHGTMPFDAGERLTIAFDVAASV